MIDENQIPTIASWWCGWRMSWIEQTCLRSFIAKGHKAILYTNGEVDNVPEGVEQRPDTEIWNPGKLITYQGKDKISRQGSYALHSDLFRYHLMDKTDYIWVDTDMYCYRRFPKRRWLLGEYRRKTATGSILRMPKDSKTLQLLIKTFASGDESPILHWYHDAQNKKKPKAVQYWQKLCKLFGWQSTHISYMNWGTVGPIGLDKFLEMTGEKHHVLPDHILYGLRGSRRQRYEFIFGPEEKLIKHIPHDSLSFHLSTSTLHNEEAHYISDPPKDSWLVKRAYELGIDPAQAPQVISKKP